MPSAGTGGKSAGSYCGKACKPRRALGSGHLFWGKRVKLKDAAGGWGGVREALREGNGKSDKLAQPGRHSMLMHWIFFVPATFLQAVLAHWQGNPAPGKLAWP